MINTLKFIPVIKIIYNRSVCKFQRLNYSKTSSCLSSTKSGDENTFSFRHKFHTDCEEGLNKQINLELQASYTYFCMWACLSRPDVALPGFAQFFATAAEEERHHAQMLATFVNTRGGEVQLRDVPAPTQGHFHDPGHALQTSIQLETAVLVSLEELHKTASTHEDHHLTDFLESHFIPEGYEGIRQLADMLTRLKRAGPGVGVVLLDLDLVRNPPNMHDGVEKGKGKY